MFKHRVLVTTFALGTLGSAMWGQGIPVGDGLEDYLRVLQVAGLAAPSSFTIRPLGKAAALASIPQGANHPWQGQPILMPVDKTDGIQARLTDMQLNLFDNTTSPWGQNDGAVWQGRGLTSQLSVGGMLRVGPVTLEVRPSLIWNQNRSFVLDQVSKVGRSKYGNAAPVGANNPWTIDLPQRFGPDPYWTLDPGQSRIQVEWAGAVASFGTENLWWGPGIQNSIIMSNNAPGFPHFTLATGHPLNVGIGTLEAQYLFGRLRQSSYFDADANQASRVVNGVILDFGPSFFPGLHLGMTRLYYNYCPAGGLKVSDYTKVFGSVFKKGQANDVNLMGDDEADQLGSFFARWLLPASGVEFYAEWARNDHNWDLRDLILEPEHSQGYTLGFQCVKALSGGRLFRVNGEMTHLERDTTQALRIDPSYYAHHIVTQGYTQRGQVIGAGIGPGGNSQYLGVDWFTGNGKYGVSLQRKVINNDALYINASANGYNFNNHDVELTAAITASIFYNGLEVSGGLARTREYNRYYQLLNDQQNLNFQVSVHYRFQ